LSLDFILHSYLLSIIFHVSFFDCVCYEDEEEYLRVDREVRPEGAHPL